MSWPPTVAKRAARTRDATPPDQATCRRRSTSRRTPRWGTCSARRWTKNAKAAETRLDRLAEAVAAARNDELPAALAEYDRALAEFQALGGAVREADADAVLVGLGMPDVDAVTPRDRAAAAGRRHAWGWRACSSPSRICSCWTSRPTIWTSSRSNWLEGFLADYDGAVLIVSHDRAFLDRTVSRHPGAG